MLWSQVRERAAQVTLRCSYKALNVPEGGTPLAGAAMGYDFRPDELL